MTKDTAIKIGKLLLGLGVGVLATYGIYLFFNTGKSTDKVDTTGMSTYQIVMAFEYKNLVENIYDVLSKFKYADVTQGVINDAANNPKTIVLTIMALPDDAPQITEKLASIAPDIKFTVINSNQKTITN